MAILLSMDDAEEMDRLFGIQFRSFYDDDEHVRQRLMM